MTKSAVNSNQWAKPASKPNPLWMEIVMDRVGSIQFGAVEIVIQDSKVLQIESTERLRLDQLQNLPAPRRRHSPPRQRSA